MQAQIALQQDVDLKRKLFKVPETCAHVSYSKAVTHTLHIHYSRVRHPLYTHCWRQRHNRSGKRLLHISDQSGYSTPPFFTFKLCSNGNIFHRYYIFSVPYSCVCPVEGTLWKHRLSANCSWSLVYPDPILWPMTYDLPTSYQTMWIHSDTPRASRKQMWWSQTLIPSIRGDIIMFTQKDSCRIRKKWPLQLESASAGRRLHIPFAKKLPGINWHLAHLPIAQMWSELWGAPWQACPTAGYIIEVRAKVSSKWFSWCCGNISCCSPCPLICQKCSNWEREESVVMKDLSCRFKSWLNQLRLYDFLNGL